MSERCPECGSDLIELCQEQITEAEYSATADYLTEEASYWEFYGYWCPFCEKMYEPHTKRWLEPWQSEAKKNLDGQVQVLKEELQSLSEKAKKVEK